MTCFFGTAFTAQLNRVFFIAKFAKHAKIAKEAKDTVFMEVGAALCAARIVSEARVTRVLEVAGVADLFAVEIRGGA